MEYEPLQIDTVGIEFCHQARKGDQNFVTLDILEINSSSKFIFTGKAISFCTCQNRQVLNVPEIINQSKNEKCTLKKNKNGLPLNWDGAILITKWLAELNICGTGSIAVCQCLKKTDRTHNKHNGRICDV